jgi:hypothetical protein
MSFGLPLMLFGLAGVAIPPLIHLLNRRRYDVVDWGAMQFLQISETTRRRLLIEELILMLLRMGLIAIMVLALAAPRMTSEVLAQLAGRPNRDVVFLFDGSYSMGYSSGLKTPQEVAKEWATAYVNDLIPGDGVAIHVVRQQVVPLVAEPTQDLDWVRHKIGALPAPRGSCDWPRALKHAQAILAKSQRPYREIIILSDGQKFGWADEDTLFDWRTQASGTSETQASQREDPPKIRVVNVAPDRSAKPVNWALTPLRAAPAVAWAGQEIKFHSAIELTGHKKYELPHRIRLEIDGKPAPDLTPPPARDSLDETGQVALSFRQRFLTPGWHLVSVILEPDPPKKDRPPGYRIKDELPGDNRQDLAFEVRTSLPVLLVDGDDKLSEESSTFFLQSALGVSLERGQPRVVQVTAIPVKDFHPRMLDPELDKKPGSKAVKPLVLVLADVPSLAKEQQDAVARFLADGGGVLVTVGERVEGNLSFYNKELYSDAKGWLPTRLEQISPDKAPAVRPNVKKFFHAALDMFREADEKRKCSLDLVQFPRWCEVKESSGSPVAFLTNGRPMFIEGSYQGGRVMLSTVPFDRSWGSNLPQVLEFPAIVHQLFYYLAGAPPSAAEHNLVPGQPLRFRPDPDQPEQPLVLHWLDDDRLPAKQRKPTELATGTGALTFENTFETGPYRLKVGDKQEIYYVVHPDRRESDLTPCSQEDRKKVADCVPLNYEDVRAPETLVQGTSTQTLELWWWFMIGVVLLLCAEVWLTRRIALSRAHHV